MWTMGYMLLNTRERERSLLLIQLISLQYIFFCNEGLPGASSSVSESASSKAPAISLNLRERKNLNITIQQLLKLKYFSMFTLVLFQCAINGRTQILNPGLFLPNSAPAFKHLKENLWHLQAHTKLILWDIIKVMVANIIKIIAHRATSPELS